MAEVRPALAKYSRLLPAMFRMALKTRGQDVDCGLFRSAAITLLCLSDGTDSNRLCRSNDNPQSSARKIRLQSSNEIVFAMREQKRHPLWKRIFPAAKNRGCVQG